MEVREGEKTRQWEGGRRWIRGRNKSIEKKEGKGKEG